MVARRLREGQLLSCRDFVNVHSALRTQPGLGPEASRATLSCAKVARRAILEPPLNGGPPMHSKDKQMAPNSCHLQWILHIQGPPGGFVFIYNHTFRLPGGCFTSTEGSLHLRESDGRLSYNHPFCLPGGWFTSTLGQHPPRGQLTFEQPSDCAIPWPFIFEHPSTILSQKLLRDPMVFVVYCAIQRGACWTSISLRRQ